MEYSPKKLSLDLLLSLVSTPLLVCEIPSLRLTMSNEGVSDITGYSPSKIKDLTLPEIFSEDSAKSIEAMVDIASQGPVDLMENELWLRRKSGRRCPVRISVKSLHNEDQIFLVINLIDLSEERKQSLERQKLIQESARVSKLADIGQLAAGMAHELNNPLAIMTGYLEAIEQQLQDSPPDIPALQQSFEPVQNAAQRMSKIVSSMLAKVRNDVQTLSVVSLKKIVDESLMFLEQILKLQSIDMDVQIDSAYVNCDQVQIDQIITNIVSNACNALDGRKDPKIRIFSECKNKMVRLAIWNNGDPIPEKTQEKLFTPFFTTKAVGEGTGLGLYMSYQIMKAHHGQLSFESAQGKGTTFFLTFPEAEEVKEPIKKDLIRALVVEDDTFFRKLVCKKLEKMEIQCIDCRDTFEAEIILKNETEAFHLVLVDYNLPKIKGISLADKLTEVHKNAKLILMSGALERAELEKMAKASGFDGYLAKPIVKSELEALLSDLQSTAATLRVG